ncbi:hypothetical protein HQ524_03170 [Candidatus Uhrbacteria bacterium]|nr:hypothetical protein [Candidatus Uhrbacteria bacterium]
MSTSNKNTMIDDLLTVLLKDTKAVAVLKKESVKPKVYVAYVYDSEIRKSIVSGYAIGAILTTFLGWASYSSAIDLELTVSSALLFAICGVALGVFITFGALRIMKGKQSKYVGYPGETASGFSLLGIVNRLSYKAVNKISSKTWDKIRAYSPDFSSNKYKHLPSESKMTLDRKALMKMTPRKKLQVDHLKRAQKISLWFLPIGVLTFFTDGLLPLWIAIFFGGVWFCAEGLIGWIERKIGFFSASSDGELYGWPARVSALVIIMTAVMLGIIPGILGTAEALGVDLIELFF